MVTEMPPTALWPGFQVRAIAAGTPWCRAVCLALLILDDCCTRVWAMQRTATDGPASAHGIGYTAKTSLVRKSVESRTTRFAGCPEVIIGSL